MESADRAARRRTDLAVPRISTDFGYGFATAQDPSWTLRQVLLATGGRFLGGRTHIRFRAVSTDSRTLEPGDLFVALAGSRFDGTAFVEEAVRKGAAGVVVSAVPPRLSSVPVVLVEDTLRALGDLAAYRRGQLPHLEVLAITGSSGKTTVKEMTAAILVRKCQVLKTEGNFNNLIGLPLSLLPASYRHDVAVLEMGMNQPGEIARLTEIADPDLACIVNIQPAHLAGLKSIEGVARAKAELFDGLKSWGKLVVNLDDERVRQQARGRRQEQITFGRSPRARVRATHLRNLGERGMAFTLHVDGVRERVHLQVYGAHNVLNALAAAALAYGAGMRVAEISAGLASFRSYDKRLQVQQVAGGLKVVNDSYNANPSSVLAALEALQGLSRRQRAVVVLGDMLELGKTSVAAHRFVGESVARLGFAYLFTVGEYAAQVARAARKAGMSRERVTEFGSKQEVAEHLLKLRNNDRLSAGDWVLIKGSRGMRMEEIVAALAAQKNEAR